MKRMIFICQTLGILLTAILTTLLTNCTNYEKRFTDDIDMILKRNDMPYSNGVIDSIFAIIKKCPSSLSYQLDEWNDFSGKITVATSNDDMVRSYTIDRLGFGGIPSLGLDSRTLIQYRQSNNINYFEFGKDYGVIKRISKIEDTKGYYLFEYYHGQIGHNQISLYVYDLSGIKPRRISKAFKTGASYSETFNLYWEDWGYDEDWNEKESIYIPEEYMENGTVVLYNWFSNTLYVSNTIEYGPGYILLDGTYSIYKWNNDHFEHILPNSKIEVRNKDYYISIIQKEDGSCTYRCWNNGVKKGVPDLVILNGTKQYWDYNGTLVDYNKWIADDESTPLGTKYIFTNNGYRYEYISGTSHGNHETLYVFSPSEKVLYVGDFDVVYN